MMRSRPWRGTAVLLGIFLLLLTTPRATALETRTDAGGHVSVEVPATPGAAQLWLDVEAPGLTPDDVSLQLDGGAVALRATPLGVGAIHVHAGTAATLTLGLRVDADVDVAITLVDAQGRILFSDGARLELTAVTGPDPSPTPTSPEPTPPTAEPTPSSPEPSATPSTSATSRPTDAETPTERPTTRPRPKLPNTGGGLS